MCGIAGIIGQISNNQYRVKRMINIINHRGPDATGFYCDNFIALGHARLRIIDLDQKADQPMFNADKSIVVVFNGEIYNYKELKKRLSFYPYKSKSDTEVILAAYEKWGTDCVQYLKGMFAFVIYDKKNNLIFGARDRFGIKPFYYYKEGDNLFFASEIKSILSQIKEISPNHFIMMKWFLSMDIDHLNETFFKNVYQLLPGESFYFKNNTLFLKRYYDIKDHIHVRNNFKEHDAIEACKELFTKSIKEHMQSDVPVGIYFSGGLDSTAIVGVLKKVLKYDSLFTLTAVSNSVSQYEKDILLRMAKKLGIDAHFCDTNNIDTEKFLYRTMWHMEMPFSISNVCDDILNKAAKDQNTTVVIEGQGSDEVQAGYYHHYKAFLIDLLFEGKMLKFYDNFKNAKWPNKIENLKKELVIMFLKSINSNSLNFNYLFSKNTFNNKRLSYFSKNITKNINIENHMPNNYFKNNLYNSLYKDIYTKMQRVLRYKDRMSMSYSRELRVPFLDHELVELLFATPNYYKIKSGIQKSILKKAMTDIIPKEAVDIPKNIMLRGKVEPAVSKEFKNFFKALLLDSKTKSRNLFQIGNIVKSIENANENNLWRLGQIELWHRIFIDKNFLIKYEKN